LKQKLTQMCLHASLLPRIVIISSFLEPVSKRYKTFFVAHPQVRWLTQLFVNQLAFPVRVHFSMLFRNKNIFSLKWWHCTPLQQPRHPNVQLDKQQCLKFSCRKMIYVGLMNFWRYKNFCFRLASFWVNDQSIILHFWVEVKSMQVRRLLSRLQWKCSFRNKQFARVP
jgi:uncharacterized membrane protein